MAKVRGNCISRFVLRNSTRIFYRFSQNEVFNLCYRTKSLKCETSLYKFSYSSVGKALEILGFNFTWCTVLFIQLIQNKNLEMFRAIPRKINLENFRTIQLGPCGISRYISRLLSHCSVGHLKPQFFLRYPKLPTKLIRFETQESVYNKKLFKKPPVAQTPGFYETSSFKS